MNTIQTQRLSRKLALWGQKGTCTIIDLIHEVIMNMKVLKLPPIEKYSKDVLASCRFFILVLFLSSEAMTCDGFGIGV